MVKVTNKKLVTSDSNLNQFFLVKTTSQFLQCSFHEDRLFG